MRLTARQTTIVFAAAVFVPVAVAILVMAAHLPAPRPIAPPPAVPVVPAVAEPPVAAPAEAPLVEAAVEVELEVAAPVPDAVLPPAPPPALPEEAPVAVADKRPVPTVRKLGGRRATPPARPAVTPAPERDAVSLADALERLHREAEIGRAVRLQGEAWDREQKQRAVARELYGRLDALERTTRGGSAQNYDYARLRQNALNLRDEQDRAVRDRGKLTGRPR